ncbi:MAG: hypothetical protein P8X43_04845 [Maritimibacter sp.]
MQSDLSSASGAKDQINRCDQLGKAFDGASDFSAEKSSEFAL